MGTSVFHAAVLIQVGDATRALSKREFRRWADGLDEVVEKCAALLAWGLGVAPRDRFSTRNVGGRQPPDRQNDYGLPRAASSVRHGVILGKRSDEGKDRAGGGYVTGRVVVKREIASSSADEGVLQSFAKRVAMACGCDDSSPFLEAAFGVLPAKRGFA